MGSINWNKEQVASKDIAKKPLSRTIFVTVLFLSGCWLIGSLALYQFRNSNQFEFSKRFVRNNEIIKSEVGDILQITDANVDAAAERYAEIRRRIQNGEGLANLDDSRKKESSKITSVVDSWETASSLNVKGSKKTIKVIVHLAIHNFSDNQVAYHYTVIKAKYADETETWKEIPVGFLENYLLLFK